MEFNLIRPCHNCPFRTDVVFPLDVARVEEILRAILQEDRTFACHNTTRDGEWIEDDDGEEVYIPSANAQHCVGAILMVYHTRRPNAMLQIAERLKLFDPTRLDYDAPVFTTTDAMLTHMAQYERRK